MTLLGELALAFVLESTALAALWLALGIAAAFGVMSGLDRRVPTPASIRAAALGGLAGAMVIGSLAARFGVPEPLIVSVGRRDVPLVWSLAGALAGSLAVVAVRRRRRYAGSGSTSGQSISG